MQGSTGLSRTFSGAFRGFEGVSGDYPRHFRMFQRVFREFRKRDKGALEGFGGSQVNVGFVGISKDYR